MTFPCRGNPTQDDIEREDAAYRSITDSYVSPQELLRLEKLVKEGREPKKIVVPPVKQSPSFCEKNSMQKSGECGDDYSRKTLFAGLLSSGFGISLILFALFSPKFIPNNSIFFEAKFNACAYFLGLMFFILGFGISWHQITIKENASNTPR